MSHHACHSPLAVLATLLATTSFAAGTPPLPPDHRTLARSVSYSEMAALLHDLDGIGPVRVSVEGTTSQGRSIFLVHLSHGGTPAWRVLFYAQQHGDEVSGKDALLVLIRDVARDPALLPRDVDVWIIPQMNPDGAEAGSRRNAAGADLNRDHMTLDQPETQALYRVVQRVRPDLAVDCHEFTRDSESRRERGWLAWPDITMDGLNNPLFDPPVVAAAERWVAESADGEARAGHNFLRYSVGGLPPDDEQRPSAPDLDGGLNGVGAYGGLSFIIEAAVSRSGGDSAADLGSRVDAYLVLLRRFIAGDGHRSEDLAAIAHSRARTLPAFVPTNYLWVNPGIVITEFPVIDVATGATRRIPTANMMTEMAVKTTVPTPAGYAVTPPAAETFRTLVERHAIPFEILSAPRRVIAERCTLLRVEDEFDTVYSRYEGRSIVRRAPPAPIDLPAGSLWIPLGGEAAVRTALLLEPSALYALYQYPRYRALVAGDGGVPVLRVMP